MREPNLDRVNAKTLKHELETAIMRLEMEIDRLANSNLADVQAGKIRELSDRLSYKREQLSSIVDMGEVEHPLVNVENIYD